MPVTINRVWQNEVKAILEKFKEPGYAGEHSWEISYNKASQWLIIQLLRRGIYYKVFNAGAGVKVISTDAEKCPCCKRKF